MAKGSRPEGYRPVPVNVAREISERFEKSMVVIGTYDSKHDMLHTTTYGVEPKDKENAADWGELFAGLVCGEGFERRQVFEDYRFLDQGARAQKIEHLVRACRAADHAIGSVMAMRNGITDEALQDVRNALQAALALPGGESPSP